MSQGYAPVAISHTRAPPLGNGIHRRGGPEHNAYVAIKKAASAKWSRGWASGFQIGQSAALLSALMLLLPRGGGDSALVSTAGAAAAKKSAKSEKSKDAASVPIVVPAVSIAAEELRQHARALSALRQTSGLSESERTQRTRQYIAEQLYETGLLPGGDGQHGIAGLSQALSLISVRSQLRGAPQFRSTATTIPVRITVGPREVVLFSAAQKTEVTLQDSELVFVGYGITSAGRGRDDYKGVDLRGKVALMLDGSPSELGPGKDTALSASRWQSKFTEALRRGAAGALIIHDSQRAVQTMTRLRSYFGGERLLAAVAADTPVLQVSGFISDEAARRLLLAAGLDLEKQQQAAQDRDFTPSTLRVRMSTQLQNQVHSIESANIVGILPGTDETLRGEAVVLTTHVDHVAGLAAPEQAEGLLYLPGVRDRVVAAAGLLAMARATRQLPPPKRSLIFAFLSGHGESFAGAQRLLKRLPLPAERVIAQIHLDGLNVGDSRPEILQLGRGKSTLDEVLDGLAATQKRYVVTDAHPELGLFFRSESLVFARAGIPVLFVAPPDLESYLASDYLQASDIFREGWSFAGGAQDCALLYQAALWIANARSAPSVLASDDFSARPTGENSTGK